MLLALVTWLIPLPPLISFALIILFWGRRPKVSHWTALVGAGLSWLGAMIVFVFAIQRPNLSQSPITLAVDWLPMGEGVFQTGIQIDSLSTVVLFFVAWTLLMIFIYSIGYHNYGYPLSAEDKAGLPPAGVEINHGGHLQRVPSREPLYSRFFAFISLFAFAMFTLVVTDNLLFLYIGWEIMGLCSYLLIGFWFARPAARDAAVKAFITTRIGDMFMLLGMAALYSLTGSLNYRDILSNPAVLEKLATTFSPVAGLSWSALIGLLIFAGTVGKSAQFPLHVWLPDAMEGPTPVSAMIHAATMVSAGVYLVIRFYPLISAGALEPGGQTAPMMAMMWIGTFTALFAASIALVQSDIKRVLAYSTISQLGFMIAALGVGAYVAAVFHLVMHAFFKALLFLGSGSVIHGMQHGAYHSHEDIDPQNMFNMGGLAHKMPVTFWGFLAGGLSLAGFPYITAGFWSKDEILAGVFGGGYWGVFVTLAVAAFLTAFYTIRQITLVFGSRARTRAAEEAGESGAVMYLPLVVLAVFAIAAGWSAGWFKPFVAGMLSEVPETHESLVPLFTSLLVSLSGLLLGWLTYRHYEEHEPDPLKVWLGPVFLLLEHKYWVDEFYEIVFIRPATWLANTLTAQWIDRVVIDGFLHALASLGVLLGTLLRKGFDYPVITQAFELIFGQSPLDLGVELKKIQTGRVQEYIVISMITVVVVGMLVVGFTFYFPR
jgi:NADH-quinone oxidoreductase subunit L